MKPVVFINKSVKEEIDAKIAKNQLKEIGGILIGTFAKDLITGMYICWVRDVYIPEEFGTSSTFTFAPQLQTDAINYIKKNYRNPEDEWEPMFHIVGNFHSHAQYDAFWSTQDKKMMEAYASNEFYWVISPSHNKDLGRVKISTPTGLKYYDVEPSIIDPDYNRLDFKIPQKE